MKYAIFTAALCLGVPLLAVAGAWSARIRSWAFSLLIMSTAFGDIATINFVSMETYRGPDRGFEVALADLIAWALLLALIGRYSGRLRWLPYNSLWMLAFFVMSLVSTVGAQEPLFSAFSLFKMVRMFVIYWVVVNVLRTGVDRRAVWRGLVGIALLMLVLVLKQRYLDGYYRVPGPFAHANTIPVYLNMFLPAMLLWALGDWKLSRARTALTTFAVMAMLFAVYATFSRAGLTVALTGLLGAMVYLNVRLRSSRVAIATAVVVLLTIAGAIRTAPRIVERFREAPEESLESRYEFNEAAWLMATDRILGVGINNFSAAMTTNRAYREHVEVMANEKQAGVAHHIYLLTAAETGFVGLLLFLIIIGRFTWLPLWYGLRSSTREGMLLFGYFMGFVGFHLAGLLEWAFRITPVLTMYFISVGFCVALVDEIRHPSSEEGDEDKEDKEGGEPQFGTVRRPVTFLLKPNPNRRFGHFGAED